jgi:Tfp pilus assembly protein PilO
LSSTATPLWRRWLLPVFLLLLVVNLLVAAVWTVPRNLRLRNATARVETAREMVEQERAVVAQQRERGGAIDANGEDLATFYDSAVGPERVELLPTLEDIEAMARAPGLTPGRRTFRRADVEDTAIERVVVTLPLEGSYGQLVGFLREVERSERFLTVDRISLRGDPGGEGKLQVEMSAFMRLEPGAPVAGEGDGAE